jgi:hypothetical protein
MEMTVDAKHKVNAFKTCERGATLVGCERRVRLARGRIKTMVQSRVEKNCIDM